MRPSTDNDEQGRKTRWAGGYIRYGQDGLPTYYIFKRRRGKVYERSTGTHKERDANEHLGRFEVNPDAYAEWVRDARREGYQEDGDPVYLTDSLRQEFLSWCSRPKAEGGKGNNSTWREDQNRVLKWWAARLVDEYGQPLDLRASPRRGHVTTALIFQILDGVPEHGVPPEKWKFQRATGVRHRQNILHAFYGWLRKHRRGERIDRSQDPMLDIPNIQGRPSTVDKVVPRENVHAVVDHLVGRGSFFGHCLLVQAGCGWHSRELYRFIFDGGEVSELPGYIPRENGAKYILYCPRHKSGQPHATKVSARVARSAAVLLKQPRDLDADFPEVDMSARWFEGRWFLRNYARAVTSACRALGLPVFYPSWMRHTYAQYAVELGGGANEKEAQAAAAQAIGHKPGSQMVKLHYAKTAIPPKPPSIMDDPEPREPGPLAVASANKRNPEAEDTPRDSAEPADRRVVVPFRRKA